MARLRSHLPPLLLAVSMLAAPFGCDSGDKQDDDASSEDGSSEGDSKKRKKKKGGNKKKKKKGSKKKKTKKKADEKASPTASEKPLPDGTYARPKPGEVPDMKVGAWSRYKMTTGEVTWGVPDKKGTQYLVDAVVRGRLNIVVSAWVDLPDEGDARSSRIVSLKYRVGGGAVQTGSDSGAQAALYKRLAETMLPPNFEGLPQEDVTVAAGTFLGCYKRVVKETFMGITTESTRWQHPAVPAPAMVKSVTKDGKVEYELIEFGATGAKKSL